MSDENNIDKQVKQDEAVEAHKALLEAAREMKTLVAENRGGQSDAKEKQEKALELLEKHEEQNQKMAAEKAMVEKQVKDLEDSVKNMEAKMAKMSTAGGVENKEIALKEELKAMDQYARTGKVEEKYIRTDVNADGGFLFQNTLDDIILKKMTEISPIRQYARVKRVSGTGLDQVLRESLTTAYWVGEGDDLTNSNSTYSQPKIPVHKLTTSTVVSLEALQGGQFDMESEIMGDAMEVRLQKEGTAFVEGTGVEQPKGFISQVGTTTSSTAGAIDWGDIVGLIGQLKTGYNPRFGFNRKTLAKIMSIEDTAGNPVWMPGNTAAGVPSQLLGIPYIEIPDMDDTSAGNKSVIIADFRELYTIVDSRNAVMIRDQYSLSSAGKVALRTYQWVGGDVSKAEAGHALLIKTA